MCCGTRLFVPESIDHFKCSICDTLHDTRVITRSREAELRFDLGQLQSALTSGSSSQVSNLFGTWFRDVDSVNHLFRAGLKRLHHSRPDIDYEKVSLFYATIEQEPPETMHLLFQSIVQLLKRPTTLVTQPQDCYFLLVLLENPLLRSWSALSELSALVLDALERIMGITAHLNKRCKGYMREWIASYPVEKFEAKVDLMNAYLSRRLAAGYSDDHLRSRRKSHHSESRDNGHHDTTVASSRFQIRTRLSADSVGPNFKKKRRIRPDRYSCDWRMLAAVRSLQLLFESNTLANKVPLEAFYNTMVDCVDVIADFENWQRAGTPEAGIKPIPLTADLFASSQLTFSQPRFAVCQYPFLISIGSKSKILEYDAKVQMELKAQEAFFGSLASKKPHVPHLYIQIRRNHILEDSFESIRKNEANLKKSLRVEFVGEPGIDEGGLKKEWLLLLLRELFAPKRGIYLEDDESHFCWFDTACTETLLDYYRLTGIAIGLAVYNSIILDIGLPPVVFKKLLGQLYTLEDFAALKPSMGKGLRDLLNYEGDDVADVFGLTFTVCCKDRRGKLSEIPLVPGGALKPVTSHNRRQYVRQMMSYILDSSVSQQFDAFKSGFYTVIGGNSLALFRPEELNRLVSGSLEALDVDALRAVTKYQHWDTTSTEAAEKINVISWFWDLFKCMSMEDQRKLLAFVTGSDRIPATGISTMTFRIVRLGDDCDSLPTSHTCFNQLCLFQYSSRDKLRSKLMTAISESQGFGMK